MPEILEYIQNLPSEKKHKLVLSHSLGSDFFNYYISNYKKMPVT